MYCLVYNSELTYTQNTVLALFPYSRSRIQNDHLDQIKCLAVLCLVAIFEGKDQGKLLMSEGRVLDLMSRGFETNSSFVCLVCGDTRPF